MNIIVTSGRGVGPTRVSAYDSALLDAGIGDFNLIELSSIIPPASNIECDRFHCDPADIGKKLYVVLSRNGSEELSRTTYAGLGWAQSALSGAGVFVEDTGYCQKTLEASINTSLDYMVDERHWETVSDRGIVVKGITCTKSPVCVVVAAVFGMHCWQE